MEDADQCIRIHKSHYLWNPWWWWDDRRPYTSIWPWHIWVFFLNMRIFIAIKWYGQWWWSNGWTRFFPLTIRTQPYIILFVKDIPYDISFYTQHTHTYIIYIYIYTYTVLYISIKANDIPYHLVIYHKYGKSLFLVLWVQQHREYRVLTQNQSRQTEKKTM